MDKKEAKFQRLFGRWLIFSRNRGVYELKYTDGASIPFAALKNHQRDNLLKARSETHGLYYKIPDDSMGQKPFDCFFLGGENAYVVVAFGTFYVFYLITIDDWISLERTAKRKSITEPVAHANGIQVAVPSKNKKSVV